jgi:hypothetical protein
VVVDPVDGAVVLVADDVLVGDVSVGEVSVVDVSVVAAVLVDEDVVVSVVPLSVGGPTGSKSRFDGSGSGSHPPSSFAPPSSSAGTSPASTHLPAPL